MVTTKKQPYGNHFDGTYLIFYFITVFRDRYTELFPSDADCLHRVLGVSILKDHGLLDFLVNILELVDVGLEADQGLLHLFEFL